MNESGGARGRAAGETPANNEIIAEMVPCAECGERREYCSCTLPARADALVLDWLHECVGDSAVVGPEDCDALSERIVAFAAREARQRAAAPEAKPTPPESSGAAPGGALAEALRMVVMLASAAGSPSGILSREEHLLDLLREVEKAARAALAHHRAAERAPSGASPAAGSVPADGGGR